MLTEPGCPLCLKNHLLKVDILAETAGGFVIQAHGSKGNFLVVPKDHFEDPGDLPDTWWTDFKQLFAKVPIDRSNYNLALNIGPYAGQTIKHLHFWVIPREPGLPTSGMGLAALVARPNVA